MTTVREFSMAEKLHCHDEKSVVGEGPLEAEVICIGIAPGPDEAKFTHRPFTGQSGKFLKACLRTAGFSNDQTTLQDNPDLLPIYMTNAHCHYNNSPENWEFLQCWPRLRKEIRRIKPKIILTLGNLVTDFMFGEDTKRSAVRWSEKFNCWTIQTVHPAAIIRGRDEFIYDLMRDLMKLKTILTWPMEKPADEVPFEVISNREDAQALLDSFEKGDIVSLDIESRYKRGTELLCLGLTGPRRTGSEVTGTGTWVIETPALQDLRWPSKGIVEWSGQGAMFDVGKLFDELGIDIALSEDTLLQSYSLDERGGKDQEIGGSGSKPVGVHGLKLLGQEYLGVPNWDLPRGVEDTWDYEPDGHNKVYAYNAKDTRYQYELTHLFRERQKADNVRGMYEELLIPAANAFAQIHHRGIFIDREAIAGLGREWIPQWMLMEEELRDESGIKNLNSSKQINDYVYDYLGFLPDEEFGRSTNKQVIAKLVKKDIPQAAWLKKLVKFRQIDHLISTYLMGIEDDIDEYGRIHPIPVLHGTRTGRLAYNNPPVNTIPKHGDELVKIRRIFAAEPGRELIEADYRQAELWVAWFHSGDSNLLAALETGDFHAATTTNVFGIDASDPEFDLRRHDSKRVTFGILYNRGAASLTESFGHSFSYWQAAIKQWRESYWQYWEWRDAEIQKVLRDGEQQSISGRKRRYWAILNHKSINQAINMPIQATSHDHLLKSLIILVLNSMLAPYDAYVLLEVHDSLLIDAPQAYRSEVIKVIRDVMQEPKFGYQRGLQVDVSAGPNWLEMEKIR